MHDHGDDHGMPSPRHSADIQAGQGEILVSGKIPVGLCPAGEYRVVVHHDAMSVTRNRYDSNRTRRRYSKAEVAEVRVRVR